MQPRGYQQGGQGREYAEGYDHGRGGRRPPRQYPQTNYPPYGEEEFAPPGYDQPPRGYPGEQRKYPPRQQPPPPRDYDNYYYQHQQADHPEWSAHDYMDDVSPQYPSRPPPQEYRGKPPSSGGSGPQSKIGPSGNISSHSGHSHPHGQAQKPFKKAQQPQPKKQQGETFPKGYNSEPFEQPRRPQQPPPKSSQFEEASESSRAGRQSGEPPQTAGSLAADPPRAHPFGEYYTYQQYQEQQKRKQLAAGQVAPVSMGETVPSGTQGTAPAPPTKGQLNTATSIPQESEENQPKTKESLQGPSLQNQGSAHNPESDERFSRTMARFNTLDRGTYFVSEKSKLAHFMVAGRADLLGWPDTYVINGYFLHGVIVKLTTLTSRIFLFIENLHDIYKEFIKVDEKDLTVKWSEAMPDINQICTVTNIEKVEVFDNDEDGFEGFVCYTVCEDSKIEFPHKPEDNDDWHYVQDLILLYEPTSIRKIYLDVVYNSIYKPESKGFGGKRIAAIVNPHVPGETIQFARKLSLALEKKCVVGTIWIQNGKYTLIAETLEDMDRLVKLVDLSLDIAEELNAYVMITNLRRTFDYAGKTILYISSDPTLKLIRSSNPISFASKVKKSANLG